MARYTMYWYDLDGKTHSKNFDSANDESAKRYALKYHRDNTTAWAVGLSVYNDRGVLIADWSKNAGRWNSNIRKRAKKDWHPFGL